MHFLSRFPEVKEKNRAPIQPKLSHLQKAFKKNNIGKTVYRENADTSQKIKGYYSALITTYEKTISAKILGLGIGAGGGSEITALPSHSSSILCLENSLFFHGILCCLECTYSELDEDEPEDELEPGPRPPLSLLPRRLLRPPSRWPPFEPMNMVVRVWWWRCRRSSSLSPS